MAANEAGTVVRPHPAATRCSLVSQSRAVWVILGRQVLPWHSGTPFPSQDQMLSR